MTTIFFLYGLAFFILGFSILIYPKKDSRFMLADKLWLIAVFGIIHGINEWLDMFKSIQRPTEMIPLKITGMIIMPVSFLFLIYFGAKTISETRKRYSILKFLPIILLIPWATIIVLSSQPLLMWGVWARYLLGTPGTFLTSYALLLQVSEFKKTKQLGVVRNLYILLISFAFYGIFSGLVVPEAGFLPASVLNYTLFSDIIGIPVQVFRTLCAIAIAYSVIRVLWIFDWETKRIKNTLEETLNAKNRLAEANAYIDNIFESIMNSLIVVDVVVGQGYRIKFVNKATLNILGYTEDELIGKPALMILSEDEQPGRLIDVITRKNLLHDIETYYLTKDGRKIPMLFSAVAMHNNTGKTHSIIFAASDISKLKQAEKAMKKTAEERDRTINEMKRLMDFATTMKDEIHEEELIKRIARFFKDNFHADIVAVLMFDREKNVLDVPVIDPPMPTDKLIKTDACLNPSLCHVIRTGHECVVRDINKDIPCECISHNLKKGGYACLPLITSGITIGAILIINKENVYWKSKEALALLSSHVGLAATTIQRVRLMELTKHAAVTDALTGIYNRRFFDEMLEKHMALTTRRNEPLSLIIADIDHFKKINDVYGHTAGDRALQQMSKIMKDSIRKSDILARYGGEEFVIIMPSTDTANALKKAEVIRRHVESINFKNIEEGKSLKMTISIGIASFPEHDNKFNTIVDAADNALYRAKKGGRNRVEGP